MWLLDAASGAGEVGTDTDSSGNVPGASNFPDLRLLLQYLALLACSVSTDTHCAATSAESDVRLIFLPGVEMHMFLGSLPLTMDLPLLTLYLPRMLLPILAVSSSC